MKLAGAYINNDTYKKLIAIADKNNRTLAGQCRHLFDACIKADEAPKIEIPKRLPKFSKKKS